MGSYFIARPDWVCRMERGRRMAGNEGIVVSQDTRLICESLDAIAKAIKDKTDHDWLCGCGHWNGANLVFCARCGRAPGGD